METKRYEAVDVETLRNRLGRMCSPDRTREGYVIGPDINGRICHVASCTSMYDAKRKACQLNGHDGDKHKVTCGNCKRSWCERCDPAPSALCHWCHGRGHSEAEIGPDVDQIYDDCVTGAEECMARNKREARGKGWIIVSRGFEMLSLDENQERDENIVDYVDDDKLTAEVIQEYIDDVRKSGSAYLAIGWGVDQADDQEGYDCGDYSPMHDWIDFENIRV